jgi:hypothetical protein
LGQNYENILGVMRLIRNIRVKNGLNCRYYEARKKTELLKRETLYLLMYDGKSISKLQMDIELKQIRVLI